MSKITKNRKVAEAKIDKTKVYTLKEASSLVNMQLVLEKTRLCLMIK